MTHDAQSNNHVVLCPFCWQEMDVDYPTNGFGPWHTRCEDENPWGWDLRWSA